MKKQIEAKMIVFEDINNKSIGVNLNKVIEFEIIKCTDDENYEFELLMNVPSYDEDTSNVFHYITEETRNDVLQQIRNMMGV